MTGICAVAGNRSGPASTTFESVLDGLTVRGSSRRTISAKGPESFTYLMGYRESGSGGLTSNGDFVIALDGFHIDENVLEKFSEASGPSPFHLLFNSPGAYAFVAVGTVGLVAGRDPLGQKPLYYGSNIKERLVGFASLKSALENAGIENPKPVPPGELFTISTGEPTMDDRFRLVDAQESDVSEEQAVHELGRLLQESTLKTVPEGSGIAFSGGLDSGLVAQASKLTERSATLVTVGLEGQSELEHAQNMADEMKLPIIVRELTKQEVVDLVPEVVETIETVDPTIVSVALPFFAACQVARAEALKHIVAGQLSDELFAGYGRFEKLAGKNAIIRQEVWDSVKAASRNDFEPGDKIAVSNRLELRCPFAYQPLVDYGLKIPAGLKVNSATGVPVRKYILRKLATSWNMPSAIVNRPKRAIQYSTGVMNVLEKEAKSRGLGLKEFFQEQIA